MTLTIGQIAIVLIFVLILQGVSLTLILYGVRKSVWASKAASSAKRAVQTESENATQQLEHLASLYRKTGLNWGDLPPTRGWAASPDFLNLIYDLIVSLRPNVIVELGSGTSTLISASALKHNGTGTLYTIDHDEKYLQQTKTNLSRLQLDGRVVTSHAPLSSCDQLNPGMFWYNITPLHIPEKIDMLIIDGPPEPIVGPGGRAPAVDAFFPRLSNFGCVIFDDAKRIGEKNMLDNITARYPQLNKESYQTEKGAVAFFSWKTPE